MNSIRSFLLSSTLLLTGTILAVLSVYTYYDVRKNIYALFDAQLIEMAHYMRGFAMQYDVTELSNEVIKNKNAGPIIVEHAVLQQEPLPAKQLWHKYESKRVYQVWNKQGHLLARHKMSPTFPLSTMEPGYAENRMGSHLWQTYTLIDDTTGVIYVAAQRDDIRRNLSRIIGLKRTLPFLILFPLLALCICYIIGIGCKRIERFTQQLDDRAYDSLDPVNNENTPKEILPIVNAINALFHRLNEAYKREKRFSADAAHELRTPLAASKTMVQLAMKAKSISECQDILNNAQDGVDRCTHVVKQLATLSSLNPEKTFGSREHINLHDMTVGVVKELEDYASKKEITINVDIADDIQLFADLTSIQILFRNLIDNAIRYSPDKSAVMVNAQEVDGYIQLKIIDNGPGIPKELRDRVFERFYRQLGTNEEGSGLGLSIVTQICELYNAKVSLNENENDSGLCVCILFPLLEKAL